MIGFIALNLTPAAASELRAVTSEKIPYNFLLHSTGQQQQPPEGQVVGLSVDLVRALLPQQPLLPILHLPWPRAFDTALKNPDVLIFTMGKTRQREQQGFRFIGPVSTRLHGLYARKTDLPPLRNLADIRTHRLTVVGLRGGWLTSSLRLQGIDVQEVGDYQQALQMLLLDRAQLWVSSDLEANLHLHHTGATGSLLLALELQCSENYMALSPGSSEQHVQQLQQAYQQWQTSPAAAELAMRWQEKLAVGLTFVPEHGFVSRSFQPKKCPELNF